LNQTLLSGGSRCEIAMPAFHSKLSFGRAQFYHRHSPGSVANRSVGRYWLNISFILIYLCSLSNFILKKWRRSGHRRDDPIGPHPYDFDTPCVDKLRGLKEHSPYVYVSSQRYSRKSVQQRPLFSGIVYRSPAPGAKRQAVWVFDQLNNIQVRRTPHPTKVAGFFYAEI
jgi:hypothetical protein